MNSMLCLVLVPIGTLLVLTPLVHRIWATALAVLVQQTVE
jgi:hypothetical protein